MPQKHTSTPFLAALLLQAALSPPFLPNHVASAACDSVRIVGNEHPKETVGKPFQITPLFECSSSSQSSCDADAPAAEQYAPVIHPVFNATVSDPRAFLQLFYDAIVQKEEEEGEGSGAFSYDVDLNTTSVAKIMGAREWSSFSVPGGQSAYVKFAPWFTCWDGVVAGCDGGDKELEGDGDGNKTTAGAGVLRVCAPQMAGGMDQPMEDWRFEGVVGPVAFNGTSADDDHGAQQEPTLKSFDEVKDQATNDVGDYVSSGEGDDDDDDDEGAAASVVARTWYGTLGLGLLVSAALVL